MLISNPSLLVKKLWHKEVRKFARGHIPNEWRGAAGFEPRRLISVPGPPHHGLRLLPYISSGPGAFPVSSHSNHQPRPLLWQECPHCLTPGSMGASLRMCFHLYAMCCGAHLDSWVPLDTE